MKAKTELTRDAIVQRALEIADVETVDAVTIRRLGQEFGVTPMALYWHVKNKDELLDAMGDALFADLAYETDPEASWDQQLAAVVRALITALRKHPGSRELAYRRVMVCPEGLAIAEHTLRVAAEISEALG